MRTKRLPPAGLWGAGTGRGKKKRAGFPLSPARYLVNRSCLAGIIRFRSIVVNGIALMGWPFCPWLSRFVDRLTVMAEALVEKSEVRA